jgi:outer membrane receptor for ferrienterochelin and colicins
MQYFSRSGSSVYGGRLLIFMILISSKIGAQQTHFEGQVLDGDKPLSGAHVALHEIGAGAVSNAKGYFKFESLPFGSYVVRVSLLGYRSITDTVVLDSHAAVFRNYKMQADALNLGEVVVTGTRQQISRHDSPIIINTLSSRTFEATQSLSISEGLHFSPGLRLENNCQNCGFTQLRMNGLEGPYSQILINSRPVFSSLAGVYGLEMLPANMVERVEVVRGGGSVLYGGNAIAGTVNIITKEPTRNSFEAGINQSFVNMEVPDQTLTFNGSIVSEDLSSGVTFFGFNRRRDPWDANGDGFSEITQLDNSTFGFDAFWNPSSRSKLKLGLYQIREFRRGGNNFHLFPHQTDLTEQLRHRIFNTNVSYEQVSRDFKHKLSVYAALQTVGRDSYYGTGGRVLQPNDTLTEDDLIAINAYGNSRDLSVVGGVQYNYEWTKRVMLITGMEYQHNEVLDQMPGYSREINQNVGTLGQYAQLELSPTDKLTLLVGGRFDHVQIRGRYDLAADVMDEERTLNVLVPRLSAMYVLSSNFKIRGSFAQGYRGPQAFDEDLHIETVGGAARFIRIAPDLETERSNSGLLSLNFEKQFGKRQVNLVAEGFYTKLQNPFILSDQQVLGNGISVINKRNGSAAIVSGLNLEANMAFGQKFVFQSGATLQRARYLESEEIWAPETPDDLSPVVATSRILRTPDVYGFFTAIYKVNQSWTCSWSGVFTGGMDVPHVIDAETARTTIKRTPTFFENNIKVAYRVTSEAAYFAEWFAGVHNLFNSFQRDFDQGMERDAGYVYGPMRPRTIFFGLRVGFN